MATAPDTDPSGSVDLLIQQARHLRGDFVSRVVTLALVTLVASLLVDTSSMLLILAAFLCTEAVQDGLARAMPGGGRLVRIGFVANTALAATIFSFYPLELWRTGEVLTQAMALGILLTAIMHCLLIRSHHLGVCLVSIAPLLVMLGVMTVPMILQSSGPADLAIGGVYGLLVLGYALHAALSQNAAHRAMARALDRAQAASRAKGRFLSSMSHEIRTPLNGILGIAQIAAQNAAERGDPAETELAETLLSSGGMLKAMVDDILDHAKIEAGRMEVHPAPMDVRHLVHSVLRLFEANAEEKAIGLCAEIDPDVPGWIVADKLRLHQILANLVSNAVKFTAEGRVCLKVYAEKFGDGRAELCFSVHDTGPGLSPAEIEVLFDPFTQVGSEAELAAKGTGLGLPIARELAQMMEGDIDVTSRPGEGSSFTLRITAAVTEAAPKAAVRGAGLADLTGMRVLLAEDNRTNRLIARTFVQGFGLDLVEVVDGAEAVARARSEDFDLILMDIRMPGMDGETAFLALREAGVATPVIALTANAMPEDRARYLALGMDGYLSKPLSKSHLLHEIGLYRPERRQAA